jgi:hypothetical protein
MNNFFKSLSVLVILAFCLQSNAQVSFGIHAGGSIFNFDAKNASGDEIEEFKFAPRYSVGLRTEFSFVNDLSIQAGLVYATKGTRYFSDEHLEIERKVTLSYLEIPINFVYKTATGGGAFFVGAGPYLGYGLSGKSTLKIDNIEQTPLEVRFENTWPVGVYDAIYFKPLDFGINTITGYQHESGLFFSINAQVGLANIHLPMLIPSETKGYLLKSTTDKTSRKNLGFTFSVGFSF